MSDEDVGEVHKDLILVLDPREYLFKLVALTRQRLHFLIYFLPDSLQLFQNIPKVRDVRQLSDEMGESRVVSEDHEYLQSDSPDASPHKVVRVIVELCGLLEQRKHWQILAQRVEKEMLRIRR